jgi:hypothetical protein
MLVGQKIDQGRRPRLPERPRWGDLRAAAGARPRFEGEDGWLGRRRLDPGSRPG